MTDDCGNATQGHNMSEAVTCQAHERLWRGRAVDRNLADSWLEKLNALRSFDLVSICEGHCDARAASVRRRPAIILRPKTALLKLLTERWFALRDAWAAAFDRLWPEGDTIVELEVQHGIVKDEGPAAAGVDIILRITCRRPRSLHDQGTYFNGWFAKAIFALDMLDHLGYKQTSFTEGEYGSFTGSFLRHPEHS